MDSIVFFGTEAFSLAALQALVEGGYTVAAVVTKPDRPQGRGMRLQAPVVKTYALEHGLPVLQPDRLAAGRRRPVPIMCANRQPVVARFAAGHCERRTWAAAAGRDALYVHPAFEQKRCPGQS